MFVSSRSFQGGSGGTESITLRFPVDETITRYIVNTNAINWTLSNINGGVIDTQMYQYNLKNQYILKTPWTGNLITFTSNLVQGSNALSVSNLYFTNDRLFRIFPEMTGSSMYSDPVQSTGGVLPEQIGQWLRYGNTAQYQFSSNVECTEIRLSPPVSQFILSGSNNGSSWYILSQNSNTCTPIASNVFRVSMPGVVSAMRMFDSIGNELTSENGGAYKGLTTGGEWIEVAYTDNVSVSVYSFSVPAGRYPTRWIIQGDKGSGWDTLDEQRNVYTQYTVFSNSMGSNMYSRYRMVIKSYSGSKTAQISSFNLYDDSGTPLTPATTTTSITPPVTCLPTSVIATTTPLNNPLFANKLYNGTFEITFSIPVALYKVYLDTTSSTLRIIGDGFTILDTITFNKVAETTNRIPCKTFKFLNINGSSKNLIMFGSKGRLNPEFTSTSTSLPVYGGHGKDVISISLPPNSSNGNFYSFVSTLAAWTLEGNNNGTWDLLDSVSNSYTQQVPYQNYFKSNSYSEYRLEVKEIQPSLNTYYRMNCFQIMSNSFTPMIPLLTSNETTSIGKDTLVSSSLVGRFDIRCTDTSVSTLISNLFTFGNSEGVSLFEGSEIYITLPYPKPVSYYHLIAYDGFTCTVRLRGSFTDESNWSNVLSEQVLTFSRGESKRILTSNSHAFRTYGISFDRTVKLKRVGLDTHMPNGSTLSYGNEMYGASGSNQWIQFTYSTAPTPLVSCVKIETNTVMPSNIILTNDTGSVIGSFNGYSNDKSITIPLTTTSNVIRITAHEMNPNPYRDVSFYASNVQFYSSKGTKVVPPFPSNAPPDPLNNSYETAVQSIFGGEAVTEQSVYVNIFSNTSVSKFYILNSSLARKWVIKGSSDNISWYVLDDREITDAYVNTEEQTPYIFYNNQTSNSQNSYSYFSANILETYSSTDGSVSINEFSILDTDRNKIINTLTKNGSVRSYCGTLYRGLNGIQDFRRGDYITWTFPKVSTFNRIQFILPPLAHIKSYTLVGLDEAVGIWRTIKSVNDSTILGTYVFGGTIPNPYSAFTTAASCNFGRTIPSSVSVTLPYPTKIRYYKVVPLRPSGTLNFSNPTQWDVYTDNTLISSGDSELNQLIEIPVQNAQKFTLEIKQTQDQQYDTYIENLLLYDENGNPLYKTKNFTSTRNFQTIERYSTVHGTVENFDQVNYKTVALIIHDYMKDPYAFVDGVANVDLLFSPDPFRGDGLKYDNEIGDIISGSANVILYSQNRTPTVATRCNFESTNANTWALYGSTDGVSWYTLSINSNVITNPRPASYYKFEVSNIYYYGDGTTNISNVSVEPNWPPIYMSSNTLDVVTELTKNTYSLDDATLRLIF